MSTENMSSSSVGASSAGSLPAASAAAAGNPPPEYRFGTDAPEWARGKSASEVLRLTENMYQALQQGQQAPPSVITQTARPGEPALETWVNRPTDAAREVAQSVFAPQFQNLAQQNASIIQGMVRQEFADDFKRWGPEIETVIAGIPFQNRSLDILKQAVTYVRGNHVSELVAERARELVAHGGGLERADGSTAGNTTGASTRLSLDNLPPAVSETAKRVGLTTQHVVDFCKANNMTPEQWLAMANDQKVLTSTAPFTFEMGESAVGANVRPFS